MNFKTILIIIFFSLTISFPAILYDSSLEIAKYKKTYKWIYPKLYYTVKKYSHKYNVNIEKILAVIQDESRGNQFAVSRSGAKGYMQIMDFHYKGNPKDLFDVDLNIQKGTMILKYCLNVKNNNFRDAVMCYNAGGNSIYFKRPDLYPEWAYLNRIDNNVKKTEKLKYLVVVR
jgi:soluble lytic murein transglycosylase-like protein